MFSEKRHQQATILEGSVLRLGHPFPPVGNQVGGHWQGYPSPKLITVYQCQHAYHGPQAGPVFCHGGCLTRICLSLTTTKSAMMLIVLIDCFLLLRSPPTAEQ